MVTPFYNFTCDVFRFERDDINEAYGSVPVYTGIPFQILPARPDIVAVFTTGPSFASYEIWTGEDVSLQNGDKITDGTRTWIIQGEPQRVDNEFMFYVRVIGQEAV